MREYAFGTGLWWAALTCWQSGEPIRYVVVVCALTITLLLSLQRTARERR